MHTRKETNRKKCNYIQKYEWFLRRGTHAHFLTQQSTQRRNKWEINGIKQHRPVQKLSAVTFRFSVQMAEYIKILQQQQCDFNNQFNKQTRQTWKDSYHLLVHGQI